MDDFFLLWIKTLIKYCNYFQKQAFSAYNQYRIYKYRTLIKDKDVGQIVTDRNEPVTISGGKKIETDEFDLQILKLLSVNSRISTIEIAEKLKSTSTTITTRIKRPKDIGVIQEYRIYLDQFAVELYYYKANIQLIDYSNRSYIIE